MYIEKKVNLIDCYIIIFLNAIKIKSKEIKLFFKSRKINNFNKLCNHEDF